jgi:hypothetical protein
MLARAGDRQRHSHHYIGQHADHVGSRQPVLLKAAQQRGRADGGDAVHDDDEGE